MSMHALMPGNPVPGLQQSPPQYLDQEEMSRYHGWTRSRSGEGGLNSVAVGGHFRDWGQDTGLLWWDDGG